jgi:DNA invertase Pin-like site-specific DNA recombinase
MATKPTKTKRKTAAAPENGRNKLLGYARVSTTDQDLTVQRQALAASGVATVFEEKASGTKRDGRTELQKVLGVLGDGDTLVVTRLDRLGRSLRDLADVAHEIEEAGANLKVLEQAVDTSTAAGRAFFGMLAVFAAFETDVRRERQMEGIALAKRRGVYKGGRARLDRARVKQLRNDGRGPAAIARELGMARSSVYRLLEEAAGKKVAAKRTGVLKTANH